MEPLARARLALEGTAVGDTFGELFFGETTNAVRRIAARELPPGPWGYTDDTEMAVSIYETLAAHGRIDQADLAARFAARMSPDRGYGQGTFALLSGIRAGGDFRVLARGGFKGMGSFGNGAAMRVAPLGAYFASRPLASRASEVPPPSGDTAHTDADLATLVREATASAEVTHAHAEGIAGAIAVAVATALAWRRGDGDGAAWLRAVRDATPPGDTRDGIDEALALGPAASVVDAARALGNGSGVSAPDTVPLCLWVAAHRAPSFEEALWTTVSALGDRDTTCAIVGGICALRFGWDGIPAAWRAARERIAGIDAP